MITSSVPSADSPPRQQRIIDRLGWQGRRGKPGQLLAAHESIVDQPGTAYPGGDDGESGVTDHVPWVKLGEGLRVHHRSVLKLHARVRIQLCRDGNLDP